MKPNTFYVNEQNVQIAVWPGVFLNITQKMGNSFSHKGSMSIDDAGSGLGISQYCASSDLKLRWADKKSGNGLLFESTKPCELANGTVDYYHFVMWHDDYIEDMRPHVNGKTFKQGDKIYDEGTAGRATGNHVHINVAIGKYAGGYPLIQNQHGVWEIKNEVPPYDVWFINDTQVINDAGYPWKIFVETKVEQSPAPVKKPVVVKPKVLKVGSKIKFKNPGSMNIMYTTRGRVPSYVRNGQYVIGQLSVDKTKALLVQEVSKSGLITRKGIYSWVYTKDIELV